MRGWTSSGLCPVRPGKDSQPQEQPRPGLGQAECVDESVTETSPEQRGSEVHTKKTVMIKTIETRDGEVSGLPGPLTPEVGGACGMCLGGWLSARCLLPAVLVLSGGRGVCHAGSEASRGHDSIRS